MYYFKDHLNFTNNLQDNLYILRQRQLKEAAWSPSSGGPAVPESAAGTNELKDRMRNIKQSGDRPQSKEYLEMEAEVNRREGTGSKVDLVKPEGVERTVVQGTEGNEKFVRTVQTKDGRYWVDPRDRMSGEELAGRAKEVKMSVPALDIVSYGNKDDVSKLKVTVKPPQPKTTAPASSPPPTPYSERGDGLATPKVTPPAATQSSPSTAAKPESTMPGLDPTEPPYFGTDVTNRAPGQPYVVPGSQEWNNMSHDDQHAMAVRALLNNETNKFTGGRNAVDPNSPTGERARFSTDSGEGGPFAAVTNERSKIANAVLEKQRLNQNRDAINNWNKSDLADTATFPNRPFFWPKVSNNIPDTGADAGGYGPPKPSNNIPDTGADAGGYGPPKPKADPVSVAPSSSSPRAGGKPMVMYDMDGIPVSVTPPTPKPPTEYSTDIIDQGKIIMGQESVNDILDRMRNPKEISDPYEKEIYDRVNNKMGSIWAHNSFNLKNYLESQRDKAQMVERGRAAYKAEKVSSKPSWAK